MPYFDVTVNLRGLRCERLKLIRGINHADAAQQAITFLRRLGIDVPEHADAIVEPSAAADVRLEEFQKERQSEAW